MRTKGFFVVITFVALSFGCSSMHRMGAAPGGQGSYRDGMLSVGYGTGIDRTYEAAVKALTDMGITIRYTAKKDSSASLYATRPDDMAPVTIALNSSSHGATAAEIKVGDSGDEAYSRVVAKGIHTRLNG